MLTLKELKELHRQIKEAFAIEQRLKANPKDELLFLDKVLKLNTDMEKGRFFGWYRGGGLWFGWCCFKKERGPDCGLEFFYHYGSCWTNGTFKKKAKECKTYLELYYVICGLMDFHYGTDD